MQHAYRIYRWLLAALLLPLSACALFAIHYRAEPIDAQVIDADTKQPLEGVIVTANWQLESGNAGGTFMGGQLMVMEAVTDRNGHFHFPGWGPVEPKQGGLGSSSPQLLVFNAGYRYRMLRNVYRDGMHFESSRHSDWSGKSIELKRFTGGLAEYAENLSFLSTSLDTIVMDDCNWQRIPMLLLAMKHQSMAFKQANVKVLLTTADYVRTNENRCGIPADFFRRYQP